MNDIILTKEEFKLFNQDDQFGFFYDEDGWPRDNANETFNSDVDGFFLKYDYIRVDNQDNIHGEKEEKKELIMSNVMEAYKIACEVKNN